MRKISFSAFSGRRLERKSVIAFYVLLNTDSKGTEVEAVDRYSAAIEARRRYLSRFECHHESQGSDCGIVVAEKNFPSSFSERERDGDGMSSSKQLKRSESGFCFLVGGSIAEI